MTMLSAQPVTLTGEQHDRMWRQTRAIRHQALRLAEDAPNSQADVIEGLHGIADRIERALIDAQDSAPNSAVRRGSES